MNTMRLEKFPLKYIGDCEHLFCSDIESEKCLKRYFLVYDPFKNEYYRYAFCSDYLRLLIHQDLNKGTYYNPYENRSWIAKNVIGCLIQNDIGFDDSGRVHNDNVPFLEKIVRITVCDKADLSACFTLKEAMDLFLENKSRIVLEEIIYTIRQVIENYSRYKKYKTTLEKLNPLYRKLLHSDADPAVILSQIIILFINLKTKTK